VSFKEASGCQLLASGFEKLPEKPIICCFCLVFYANAKKV